MAVATVGLLHPGEMGSAVGSVLRGRGHRVVWASEGRSTETRKRAEEAGLGGAGSVGGSVVDARVLSGDIGTASALKMTYAAWTKGTAALLLAIGELARAEGVEPPLHEEWRISLPDLPERSQRAARSAKAKGWRWVGEM